MRVRKYSILMMSLLLFTCFYEKQPPIDIFFSDIRATCVTFVRQGIPDRYIGYRIVEHEPEITDEPVNDYGDQPQRLNYPPPAIPDTTVEGPAVPEGNYFDKWVTRHRSERRYFRSYENGVACFRYLEDEGIYRVVLLKTVKDGIDVWAWLESEKEITGSYIVQACFRLSGDTNSEWRHRMALVPELSEFDLWTANDSLSLTYIRQNGSWQKIEAINEKTTFTMQAVVEYLRKQGIAVDDHVIIPHGLIIRESPDGTAAAGMYWERTAKVSNHHPADCLHSYVDLGPVKPGEKKIVHGKLYWLDGDKEELLLHWQKDFNLK